MCGHGHAEAPHGVGAGRSLFGVHCNGTTHQQGAWKETQGGMSGQQSMPIAMA